MARKKEVRMSSYVSRGNMLIGDGKTLEAMKLMADGLSYYSKRVLKAITPYATADAALIVCALRHIADEVERENPASKPLGEYLEKHVKKPSLQQEEKIVKPNKWPEGQNGGGEE